ncbi:MAG: Ig-like domain-containing protein, partial [Candidatus Poribacteria bacterium]
DDQLVYFVVENIGSADKNDITVKLWADRDKDGKFEPNGGDSPSIKTLTADSSYNMWYEGPANSPPLSLRSNKSSIGYPMPSDQRFFVTVDTKANAVDGRDIQMRIPINGVKTLYGISSPTDKPILNAYRQFIDSANPDKAMIISPIENDVIYGQVLLKVDADDTVEVGKVEFYDGKPDGIKQPIAIDDKGEPWEAIWDCTKASYGEHIIYARVYDKTYQRLPKTKTINHYLDSQGVRVIVGIKRTISLSAGWNYVSFPVEPFNPNVTDILSLMGANARSIWTYNAETENWLRYDLDGPGFLNDLTTIRAGVGYQIFTTAPVVFDIIGTLPNNVISLHSGWNLVGCPIQSPIDVQSAISNIAAYSPSVWTVDPNNGEWLGYDPNNPPNDLYLIEPGRAYWVYVASDCQWTLSPSY